MVTDPVRIILIVTSCSLLISWLVTSPFNLSQLLNIFFKPRSIYIISFEIIIFLQLFSIIDITLQYIPLGYLVIIIGLLTNISGTILAIWAKLVMRDNWGPPAQHEISRQNKLITEIPFSLSRNPIYLGLFLAFVGIELSLQSWLLFLAIPVFFLMQKAILTEEKLLENHFGQKYLEYKRRVPRFFPNTL